MFTIPFVLQLLALVFMLFAAFNWFPPKSGKPVWGWLSLALWMLSFMIAGFSIGLHQAGPVH